MATYTMSEKPNSVMQVSAAITAVIQQETGTRVECYILSQQADDSLRMSIIGNECDCERAAAYLVNTQQATIEYEDRYSDPEDPDFRSWRVRFP